ncbi:hypothetical protein TIFTF001_026158 [Ficus carica]|uniref:Uncharacterized protein n=1 Tax=Ficus carica TaxID=3494 RepID=A0AA88DKQ7_FICCA|nr:hypothetical protein TIFTF001_026158 [Ficus carica]
MLIRVIFSLGCRGCGDRFFKVSRLLDHWTRASYLPADWHRLVGEESSASSSLQLFPPVWDGVFAVPVCGACVGPAECFGSQSEQGFPSPGCPGWPARPWASRGVFPRFWYSGDSDGSYSECTWQADMLRAYGHWTSTK